jgi:hypothetical protein
VSDPCDLCDLDGAGSDGDEFEKREGVTSSQDCECAETRRIGRAVSKVRRRIGVNQLARPAPQASAGAERRRAALKAEAAKELTFHPTILVSGVVS